MYRTANFPATRVQTQGAVLAGPGQNTVTRHTLLGSSSTSGDRGPDRSTPDDEARDSGTGVDNRQVHSADTARGQTTLDFTVGVSIFLLVLISIFLFVPGTLEPFTQGSQEEIVTVNRVADQLSEGQLGDPATPHILDTSCTVAFFQDTSPADCRFSGPNLTARVGVKPRQNVNVTIEGNVTETSDDGADLLCWDKEPGPNRLIERDEGASDPAKDCDTLLAIGPTAPDSAGTSVTSRRVVTINGTNTRLIVEMW